MEGITVYSTGNFEGGYISELQMTRLISGIVGEEALIKGQEHGREIIQTKYDKTMGEGSFDKLITAMDKNYMLDAGVPVKMFFNSLKNAVDKVNRLEDMQVLGEKIKNLSNMTNKLDLRAITKLNKTVKHFNQKVQDRFDVAQTETIRVKKYKIKRREVPKIVLRSADQAIKTPPRILANAVSALCNVGVADLSNTKMLTGAIINLRRNKAPADVVKKVAQNVDIGNNERNDR